MNIRAVFFTEAGRAELRGIEVPDAPLGPGEVAGPTVASVISPGTELAVYQGQLRGGGFPCQSGYAAVFRVEEVGAEVSELKPGDLALTMRPHQSWQRVAAGEALRAPAGLDPRQAGFSRLLNIGMSALTTTTARPPSPVLITGLGLVGNLAAQVFQRCGYEVLACDPVASRRELARSVGLARVREAAPVDDPELGGRVSLALECSGHEQAVLDACRMVRKRGEVVLAGVPWERRTDLYAHEVLYEVFHRYAVLRSGWEWEVPVHPTDFRGGSIMEQMAAGMRWLAEGTIRVEGLYETAAPGESEQIYARLASRDNAVLTYVLEW